MLKRTPLVLWAQGFLVLAGALTAPPAGAQAVTLPAGAGAGGGAEAPRLLTEGQVVAAVSAGNRALAAARAGAEADAQGPAQVTWAPPMVEAMPMLRGFRDGEPGVQIMARQPIPWPGRLKAEREGRALMARASALEADAMELEMVAMARMAYAELWGLQEQVDQVHDFAHRLELHRASALAQYAAGRGPQQAVLAIEAERAMLDQRLSALEEERSGMASQLAYLTGGKVIIGPGDRVAAPAAAGRADVAGDAGSAVDGHPMVQAERAMQESEEAMARMSRSMFRPDFTVGVNLNLSRMAFEGMYDQEPVMPAVGIMIPIPRGGTRARVRESELRASQRALAAEDARLRLEAEAGDAAAQLRQVRSRIATFEGTLRPTVRQAVEASMAGYQAGTLRFLELLDAQRMALEVEMELIMARVRAAELSARLDAALGRRGPDVGGGNGAATPNNQGTGDDDDEPQG